jgi:hypothetical protein
MRKYLLLLLFLLFPVITEIADASGTYTVHGIPLEEMSVENIEGIRANHFTGYTFGTTAVYNEAGGTSTADGMVDVRKYPLKTVVVKVSTVVGDGTLTVHVNTFVGTTTFSGIAVTLNVGTGTTVVPITEYCEHISIDAAATTGTIVADIISNYAREK